MGLRRDALGVDAAGDAMDERQPTTSPRIANDVAENRREKKIGGEEKKGEEDNVRLVGASYYSKRFTDLSLPAAKKIERKKREKE